MSSVLIIAKLFEQRGNRDDHISICQGLEDGKFYKIECLGEKNKDGSNRLCGEKHPLELITIQEVIILLENFFDSYLTNKVEV